MAREVDTFPCEENAHVWRRIVDTDYGQKAKIGVDNQVSLIIPVTQVIRFCIECPKREVLERQYLGSSFQYIN